MGFGGKTSTHTDSGPTPNGNKKHWTSARTEKLKPSSARKRNVAVKHSKVFISLFKRRGICIIDLRFFAIASPSRDATVLSSSVQVRVNSMSRVITWRWGGRSAFTSNSERNCSSRGNEALV